MKYATALAALSAVVTFVEDGIEDHPRVTWIAGIALIIGALLL